MIRYHINHNVVDSVGRTLDNPLLSNTQIAQQYGLGKYSARSLCISSSNDIIYLSPALQQFWKKITQHYERVGLTFSQNVIWSDSFCHMGELFEQEQLSVFYYGADVFERFSDQAWYKITTSINSKNNFIELCKKFNIPTPQTYCYRSKQDFTQIPSEIQEDDIWFLKLAEAVSGLGVVPYHDVLALKSAINALPNHVEFQIQKSVPGTKVTFYNLQYEVVNSKLNFLGLTQQMLDGVSHNGSLCLESMCVPQQALDHAQNLAEYLMQEGLQGVFAFDLAVNEYGEYYFIECNPRYNGSTYPMKVAHKLSIQDWGTYSLKTQNSAYLNFDFGEYTYNPKTQQGVIVINWGTVSSFTLGIFIAGNVAYQQEVLANLQAQS